MKKTILFLVGFPVFGLLGILLFVSFFTLNDSLNPQFGGGKPFSEMVLRWEPAIRAEAIENGIPHLVNVLLAIVQVETGGNAERWPDIFQASESLGLPPNTISCPYESIRVGVAFFANGYHSNPNHDLENIIQPYNFGFGFLNHTGYEYRFENAVAFSRMMANGLRIIYQNPVAIEINGGWRYQFGNMFYVKLINQYLQGGGGQIIGNGIFAFPVGGNWSVTSPFGWRPNPFTGILEFHNGIDLITDIPNAPIYAIADGTVVFSGWLGGYGNFVAIQHDNTTFSSYGHNSANLVRVGQRVSAGQQIATMGTTGSSTGVHLHLNILMNTNCFSSGHVNPAPLLGIENH